MLNDLWQQKRLMIDETTIQEHFPSMLLKGKSALILIIRLNNGVGVFSLITLQPTSFQG